MPDIVYTFCIEEELIPWRVVFLSLAFYAAHNSEEACSFSTNSHG